MSSTDQDNTDSAPSLNLPEANTAWEARIHPWNTTKGETAQYRCIVQAAPGGILRHQSRSDLERYRVKSIRGDKACWDAKSILAALVAMQVLSDISSLEQLRIQIAVWSDKPATAGDKSKRS